MKKLTIIAAIATAFLISTNVKAQGVQEVVDPIDLYIHEVATEFQLSESLLASLIYEESRFKVVDNLTQITNVKWFEEGCEYCGSSDISNPYVNIRICGYYLHKWAEENPGEVYLWLRAWNEGEENAKENPYYVSGYAKRITQRQEMWVEQGIYND